MAGTHRYLLHGVSLASDFALTDLHADSEPREPQVRIRLDSVPAPPPHAMPIRLGCMHWDGTRLLLSVPNIARFAITAPEICVDPDRDADDDVLQMVLLGSAWAACCHLRGSLLLHASAALVGDSCVAFLGSSRAGKSTLAALLAARGHRVAADDTCVLASSPTGSLLFPGPIQLKLWREQAPLLAAKAAGIRPAAQQPGKVKLSLPAQWLDTPQLLQHLLLLDRDGSDKPAGFTRLSTLDSLRTLAAHTFRPKIVQALGLQQQNFALCAAVAAHTEIFRWVRPWGMERRWQMVDMLEHWLGRSTVPLTSTAPGRR